ncbi:hypothetical protein C8R46DRAFT_1105349 [Mycena filopes]|nr:hypothetical protein C8R46DRAFT_1105349 [Mycena filopes]
MPKLDLDWFRPPFGEKYYHDFLLFAVPEEKYGHHTAVVWHEPKNVFRKVVAVFGRMEKEIAGAELLGDILMKRPYQWDELEKAPREGHWTDGGRVFQFLQRKTGNLQGENVVPVAVYLVKVKTNRKSLLYDGQKSSLPSGYLTYVTPNSTPQALIAYDELCIVANPQEHESAKIPCELLAARPSGSVSSFADLSSASASSIVVYQILLEAGIDRAYESDPAFVPDSKEHQSAKIPRALQNGIFSLMRGPTTLLVAPLSATLSSFANLSSASALSSAVHVASLASPARSTTWAPVNVAGV